MELAIKLLGPPLISMGDSLPRLREKSVALAAYLATEATPVRRDTLATLLWPESGQSQARGNLRTSVAELRRVLGQEAIASTQELLTLEGATEITDLHRFRVLAESDDPAILWEAVSLHRGEFLEGFTLRDSAEFDTWCLLHGESIRSDYGRLLDRLAGVEESAGRLQNALEAARKLLATDPLDERFHQLVMRILVKQREWQAALRQYQECRRILEAELEEEPDEVTESLRRAAKGRGTGSAGSAAVRGSAHGGPLVGRSSERAELHRLLLDPARRLITLEGPPGAGKTRLARELLSDLTSHFPDGALFIDLTPLTGEAEVIDAIAAAVGLRDVAAGEVDRVDSIIQAVRDTRTLLVLDNFEHVVSTAPIVARIIHNTSELTILATSRERLRLAGETSFAVSPLAIADVGAEHTVEAVRRSPAVQLFLDRARRIDPELDVTRESALLLVQICRAVDGLPLAVELAAALLRVFSLRELATHVTARLELLKDGPRELPERQQSLRQAITWSHDLLSPSEAALFARLSVFSGGAQVEAAEAVCSGGLGRDARTVSLLATLVDKNLLQRRRVARETRFDLLESIRDYAAERLDERGEREEIERAHAEYFLSQVVAVGPKLHGVHQSRWLDYLDEEHQNIQRALEWNLGRPDSIPLALRAGPILAWFWYRRGHVSQGRRSLERLLTAAPEAATGELAACIRAAGWLAFVQGDWEAGRRHYYRALDMAQEVNDSVTRALVLGDLGVAERWLGNPGAGNRHRRGALALTQGSGDAWLRARTLIWAYATTGGEIEGEPPIAELREAQSLAARVGDAWLFAHAHNGLGDLFRRLGRLDEAHAEYSRALSGFQWVGDDWLAAWTHQGLAETFALKANPDDAATHFRHAKQLFERVGDRSMTRQMGERYAAIAPRELDASGSG